MRWRGRRGSENVEDRRSTSPRMAGVGIGRGGLGIGLVLVVVFLLMGGDPRMLLNLVGNAPQGGGQGGPPAAVAPEQKELGEFVSVVLADTEEVWTELFQQQGLRYREPTLVMYSGAVNSACGFNSAATGPFYCPGDQKVYIDLSFFEEMERRLGAPGDFAQAYVIAHEVGHHVQNLLGTSAEVQRAQARAGKVGANELSVRLELQADYLAGVWAHHAQRNWQILEEGDIAEALGAANAIGDDRLQREAQGRVVPESFTHGTSEQRMRWFRRGLQTGDMTGGNTFETNDL